jgi:type IV secretory pathway VirB2 component (pilin)
MSLDPLLTADGLTAVKALAAHLADDVTAVAGSVAVLFVAVNGVKWIASSGNASRQFEARAGLTAAAVGLVIVLSANLIVQLVTGAL